MTPQKRRTKKKKLPIDRGKKYRPVASPQYDCQQVLLSRKTIFKTYLQEMAADGNLIGNPFTVAEHLNQEYFNTVTLGPVFQNKTLIWLQSGYGKQTAHAITFDLLSGTSYGDQTLKLDEPFYLFATNRLNQNFIATYSFKNGINTFGVDHSGRINLAGRSINPEGSHFPTLAGLRENGSAFYWYEGFRNVLNIQRLSSSGSLAGRSSSILRGFLENNLVVVRSTVVHQGRRLLAIGSTYRPHAECVSLNHIFLQWVDLQEQPVGKRIPIYYKEFDDCDDHFATGKAIALDPQGRFILYWLPQNQRYLGVIMYQRLSSEGLKEGAPHIVGAGSYSGVELIHSP